MTRSCRFKGKQKYLLFSPVSLSSTLLLTVLSTGALSSAICSWPSPDSTSCPAIKTSFSLRYWWRLKQSADSTLLFPHLKCISCFFVHQLHSLLDKSISDLHPLLRTDMVWSLCVLQEANPSYITPILEPQYVAKVLGKWHNGAFDFTCVWVKHSNC